MPQKFEFALKQAKAWVKWILYFDQDDYEVFYNKEES